MSAVLHGTRPTLLTIPVAALGARRCASSKRGGSSSRYLQRQRSDPFVKQRSHPSPLPSSDALSGGFVSRSAFKLLQLDDRYKFLKPGRVYVDLGAAPGGWSQAIVQRTKRKAQVFALDLLPVVDVPGVKVVQGDFLEEEVQERLRSMVEGAGGEGFVDVVVSDMMANTTGNPITDTEASLELCRAAASFAFSTLRTDPHPTQDGTRKPSPIALAGKSSVLVIKYFMSHEADVFRKEVLERHFHWVKAEKMDASRKESREQFWVCIGYKGKQESI